MNKSVSILRSTEREFRFQSGFLKKLPGIASAENHVTNQPPPGARSLAETLSRSLFQPAHITADAITSDMVSKISSTKNRQVGLPVILFREGKFNILLTTSGVFFNPEENSTGCFYWPELDFILTGDLASDKKLFRADQDINLLVSSISYTDYLKRTAKLWTYATVAEMIFSIVRFQSTWWGLLYFLFGLGLFFGSFFWVPVISKIWVNIVRTKVRKNHFRENPDHYNVIFIGRLQKVHIGFSQGADNIILCMKLGLNIFRAQRRKYGDS